MVYNHLRRESWTLRGTAINPDCIKATEAIAENAAMVARVLQRCADDAGILTGIGIGTAFGLLVAMMVIIHAIRLIVRRLNPRAFDSSEGAPETREKALAAVVAVTTLLADQSRADEHPAAGH